MRRASPEPPARVFACLLGLVLVVGGVLKSSLLLRSYGFEQGDPLEYINIAHAIAYHTGEEWWDIRPILFPLVLVPAIWLGALLPEPTGEAAVQLLRSIPLAFALAAILLTALIGRDLGGPVTGIAAAILLAFNASFNALSVSTFAEVPSTASVLAATLIALRAPRGARASLLCGVMLGLAAMLRYQSLAYVPAFGLWYLLRGGIRTGIGCGFGFAVTALVQGGLDLLAYGSAFHSLIESARYNVTSDEAAQFYGSEPADWYLRTSGEWLGVLPLALSLLGLARALRTRRRMDWLLVFGAGGIMLIWLSALSHKELRFAAQIVPFAALCAGEGIAWLWSLTPRGGRLFAGLFLATASGLGLWQTLQIPLRFNTGYVDGPKAVAAARPGATLATIPWFIARPYVDGKIVLVRGDIDRWRDREAITRVFTESDYILLREYDFATDRTIQRLVDSQYRTIESYPDQLVLLENRRLSSEQDRNPRPRR